MHAPVSTAPESNDGYKLHPDHGGSDEEMRDLNAAKTRLKKMI
jgi:hypothetical protein